MRRLIARAPRGKRLVRLHLLGADHSFEGILAGLFGGHYLLYQPKLLQGEASAISLDGSVEVPAERVLFLQNLA